MTINHQVSIFIKKAYVLYFFSTCDWSKLHKKV